MSNYKNEGWQKGKKATPTNFSKFDFFLYGEHVEQIGFKMADMGIFDYFCFPGKHYLPSP